MNIVKFAGVSIGTAIFGFVSYAIWPDVGSMYWILVGGGGLMLLCTLFMVKDGEAPDHRLARGRSVIVRRTSQVAFVRRLADEVDLESDDEEEDEKEELVKMREQTRQTEAEAVADEGDGVAGTGGYTRVMTYRQMYGDPKRRRSLVFLSLVLFSYHLANSTTTPLLGQYMSIGAGQAGLPITTGLILANSVSKVFTTWALSNDRASRLGYKKCLILGSGALCLRLALITLFVHYFNNPWALGATQILDGIGGGALGLMLMLYSHLLSRRTGHFNLNMAIVNSWKQLGAVVGMLVGGAISTEKSYLVAFPVLCAVSVSPLVFSFGISTPDLKRMD